MTLFVGPEFVTLVRNIKDRLPSVRTVITTEGGAHRSGRILLPGAMRKAAMLNQSYGLSVCDGRWSRARRGMAAFLSAASPSLAFIAALMSLSE